MITLIKLYQTFISGPLQMMFGSGCKFTPTCSQYAIEAIQKHGRIKGAYLATKRFLKCNPFSK